MNLIEIIRHVTLMLPETTEELEEEQVTFFVQNKKFCVFEFYTGRLTLKFSLRDQEVFTRLGKGNVEPVPGLKGLQGWTYYQLTESLPHYRFIVGLSYNQVAPEKYHLDLRGEPED